jgi:hypothetical protein
MPDGGHGLSRAERRRIERRRREGLREFHKATGGAIEVRLIRAEDAPAWMILATGRVAAAFRQAVVSFYEKPRLQSCITCGADFDDAKLPVDWSLTLPSGHPAPEHAMLSGVCLNCSNRYSDNCDMLAAIAEVLRRHMWPGLKAIGPAVLVAEGGRA